MLYRPKKCLFAKWCGGRFTRNKALHNPNIGKATLKKYKNHEDAA